METRKFDPIDFDIGDKVRKKNKETPEDYLELLVTGTEILNNLDGLSYQILYFDNKSEPFIAWEYEPFDENERDTYYQHLETIGFNINNKSKSKSKSKVESKVEPKKKEPIFKIIKENEI